MLPTAPYNDAATKVARLVYFEHINIDHTGEFTDEM